MAGPVSWLANDSTALKLIQQGYVERAFHDALVPETHFRDEVNPVKWNWAWGKERRQNRLGLFAPNLTPLSGEPQDAGDIKVEYWFATVNQYAGTKSFSKRKSNASVASLILAGAKLLGQQAGISIDLLARLRYFEMGLWGNSYITEAATDSTTIKVSRLLGFNKVHDGETLRDVSASNKLKVYILTSGGMVEANVVAVAPDDNNLPDGPGTLTLDAAVTCSKYDVIISGQASKVIYPNGKTGIHALGSSDVLTFAQVRQARAYLKSLNVPTFPDGTYHLHLDPVSVAQLFADPEFQRLYQGMGNSTEIQQGVIARMFGVTFIENNMIPSPTTVFEYGDNGDTIAAEVQNKDGVGIYYPIMIGAGALVENWVDIVNDINASAPALATRAGTQTVTARQVANSVVVGIDRIAMHITPPIDKLGDQLSLTWEFFGEFAQPTDYAMGAFGSAVYKRVVVLPHA